VSDLPPDLPVTPALPAEPSPITDAQLPALVEQLRGVLADVANAARDAALKAMPVPRMIPCTVSQVDVANLQVSVLTDDGSEGNEITASIISERPNPNERVMVLSLPGGAAFVVGHVGGDGVPPGALIGYVGTIDGAVSSSTGGAPPRGYAMAYGQVLKQNAVPWFFASAGTSHNTGGEAADEVRLPDMRGRFPMGLDNMGGSDAGRIGSIANAVGATGGAETHTLASGNLPAHVHDLGSHTHSFTPSGTVSISSVSGSVSGSISATTTAHSLTNSGGFQEYASGTLNFAPTSWVAGSVSGTFSGSLSGGSGSGSFSGSGGTTGSASGNTGSTGSSSAVNHLPPTMAVFWLVKL
jgi:microcystin-dependent protein